MTLPAKIGAIIHGSKGMGYRSRMVSVDSPKLGDRYRSGGKTFTIDRTSNKVSTPDGGFTRTHSFSGKDTAGHQMRSGSIIFRRIKGRIVPIVVA